MFPFHDLTPYQISTVKRTKSTKIVTNVRKNAIRVKPNKNFRYKIKSIFIFVCLYIHSLTCVLVQNHRGYSRADARMRDHPFLNIGTQFEY